MYERWTANDIRKDNLYNRFLYGIRKWHVRGV